MICLGETAVLQFSNTGRSIRESADNWQIAIILDIGPFQYPKNGDFWLLMYHFPCKKKQDIKSYIHTSIKMQMKFVKLKQKVQSLPQAEIFRKNCRWVCRSNAKTRTRKTIQILFNKRDNYILVYLKKFTKSSLLFYRFKPI